MKLNRLVLPLALALIATLAATGCKTKPPVGVTNIPHHEAVPAPQPDYNTKPIVPADNTPTVTTTPALQPHPDGRIDTTTSWDPKDYNPDPQKLAAYTVHFKFDSAVVETSEAANLAAVAAALKTDATARLLIEGHCDERGTEEYNRSLGERRALALREELAKDGVSADFIRTVSFGKDKPVDSGHDEAAWAKNRRGEFIWCSPKTPAP